MKIHKGKVLLNKNIALNTFKLVIKSEVKNAISGQFISILCPNLTLRRPFSIAMLDEDKITILYKLIGEGTNYIKSLSGGDEIDFIAPLGNGFRLDGKKSALLIGAGIGIAPMLFLKHELNKKNIKNCLVSGFKTKDEAIEGADITVIGGSVLDDIENVIEKQKPGVICSCGPAIVLKLVSDIGKKFGIETQIAMEKVMACGIGVCRGCVIKVKKNNKIKNLSVCKDGAVFKGDEVIWQEN